MPRRLSFSALKTARKSTKTAVFCMKTANNSMKHRCFTSLGAFFYSSISASERAKLAMKLLVVSNGL